MLLPIIITLDMKSNLSLQVLYLRQNFFRVLYHLLTQNLLGMVISLKIKPIGILLIFLMVSLALKILAIIAILMHLCNVSLLLLKWEIIIWHNSMLNTRMCRLEGMILVLVMVSICFTKQRIVPIREW